MMTPINGRFKKMIPSGMSNAITTAYNKFSREIKNPIATPKKAGNPIINKLMKERLTLKKSFNRVSVLARIVYLLQQEGCIGVRGYL
jgi:uncharacterized protein YdcH (DUF465 family)